MEVSTVHKKGGSQLHFVMGTWGWMKYKKGKEWRLTSISYSFIQGPTGRLGGAYRQGIRTATQHTLACPVYRHCLGKPRKANFLNYLLGLRPQVLCLLLWWVMRNHTAARYNICPDEGQAEASSLKPLPWSRPHLCLLDLPTRSGSGGHGNTFLLPEPKPELALCPETPVLLGLPRQGLLRSCSQGPSYHTSCICWAGKTWERKLHWKVQGKRRRDFASVPFCSLHTTLLQAPTSPAIPPPNVTSLWGLPSPLPSCPVPLGTSFFLTYSQLCPA